MKYQTLSITTFEKGFCTENNGQETLHSITTTGPLSVGLDSG